MSATPSPTVAIIILTWNGLELTEACLRTLRAHTHGVSYRIVMVDNGSHDGTLAWLQAQSDITLIANVENVGFTRGNNQALRTLLPGEDALLLNNDTEFFQDDWLLRLQETAHGPDDGGVIGCRLISPDGLLLHVGTYMPTHTLSGYQIAGDEVDIGQYPGVRAVEGVVGACMYIRRDVLDRVGLLEEAFFSYYEDTDYCLRARAAGYRVLCHSGVTVVHCQNASTALNQVSWNRMFADSQQTFIKKWVEQYGRAYHQRLFWHGVVKGSGSYQLSQQLVLALDEAGVDVRLANLYGVDERERENGDPRIEQLRARPKDLSLPQVVFHQGDAFYKNSGRYKIGFSMLGTTGIPADWVAQANQMDEVWVPSRFNLETFRDSGVHVPIHVVPLGVDPNYFHPDIKAQRFGPRYTFLSIFEWSERAGPDVLLRAFAQAFTWRDDVQLVLVITNTDRLVDVPREIAALDLLDDMPPIAVMYNENIPVWQMGSLYRAADCFVLPTRGEGWGLPILEAMACGLPVIATDWSGQTEFLCAEATYPLRVQELVPAIARSQSYPGFRWAEPDAAHLVELMRYIYHHQDQARETGARAATYAAANWTWAHTANKIVERLESING